MLSALQAETRAAELARLAGSLESTSYEQVVRASPQHLRAQAQRVRRWHDELQAAWERGNAAAASADECPPQPRLVLETIFEFVFDVEDLLLCRLVATAWNRALHAGAEVWRLMLGPHWRELVARNHTT